MANKPGAKFYDDIRENVKKKSGEERANTIPLGQRRGITEVGNSPAPALGRGMTKVGNEVTGGAARRGVTVIAGDELRPGQGAAAKKAR